jgi:hypothetical protein
LFAEQKIVSEYADPYFLYKMGGIKPKNHLTLLSLEWPPGGRSAGTGRATLSGNSRVALFLAASLEAKGLIAMNFMSLLY